jgi:hypothetical protein
MNEAIWFFCGMLAWAALVFLYRKLSPRLCDVCGAKAMPHTHLALVKANNALNNAAFRFSRVEKSWGEFSKDLEVRPGSTAEAEMREMDLAVYAFRAWLESRSR